MRPDSSFETSVLTAADDVLALEQDWSRLWNESPRREIFTSFPWARAFLKTYQGAGTPLVVVAKRDGAPSVILPMFLQDRVLHFIGVPHSDYCDILADSRTGLEELAAVVQALRSTRSPWQQCVFRNLSDHSRLLHMFCQPGFRPAFAHALRPSHKCPAIISGLGEDVFGQLLRKDNPRRCEKRLQERGPLDFSHIESRDEIQSCLGDFFDQHMLRRTVATNSGGMFTRELCRSFFHNLVAEFDPAGALRFAVLRVDGRPIAYHFGFELDDRYIWYVPTFDVDRWDDRPGLVMLRKLFEYASQRHLRELDFTVGDEDYKQRFANHISVNHDLTLYRQGGAGLLQRGKDIAKFSPLRAAWRRLLGPRRGAQRMTLRLPPKERVVLLRGDLIPEQRRSGPEAPPPRLAKVPLSELARRWLTDSSSIAPILCQKRLNAGHVAWAIQGGDAARIVAWVATAEQLGSSGEMAGRIVETLPAPSWIVYDFSSSPRRVTETETIWLLRSVLMKATTETCGVYLLSAQDNEALLRAATAAGYRAQAIWSIRRRRSLPSTGRHSP